MSYTEKQDLQSVLNDGNTSLNKVAVFTDNTGGTGPTVQVGSGPGFSPKTHGLSLTRNFNESFGQPKKTMYSNDIYCNSTFEISGRGHKFSFPRVYYEDNTTELSENEKMFITFPYRIRSGQPYTSTIFRKINDKVANAYGEVTLNLNDITKQASNYLVSSLPQNNNQNGQNIDLTIGQKATATDALAPTFLSIAVGGGSVVTPVFWNGTNWIVG